METPGAAAASAGHDLGLGDNRLAVHRRLPGLDFVPPLRPCRAVRLVLLL